MVDLQLYNQKILKLSSGLNSDCRLPDPDLTVIANSRICGSQIVVDINIDRGRITAYGHKVRACVIGKAAASAVAKVVLGLSYDEVSEGESILVDVLNKKKTPPVGLWEDLKAFLPVADFPSRHGTALLPFKGLKDAMARKHTL